MIEFLSSINKISLVFFLFTLSALIYEYYLFKKERSKEKIPQIPQFEEKYANKKEADTSLIMIQSKENVKVKTTRSNKIIIALVTTSFIAIIFATNFFIEFSNLKKKNDALNSNRKIIIQAVESSGIFIYDKNFKLLSDDQLREISQGAEIIVGIKTVSSDPAIDKARIRINKNYWSLDDETNQFDEKRQIYYRSYQISSNESKLKIEGQLHSITDGWLGE